MTNFNEIEDTLFVPMLGRIYATEKFPHILSDLYAAELKNKLPKEILAQNKQTQYTLMAGAVRSKNMDRYIKAFLNKNETGIIVELGAGLETSFYRNDNGKAIWYEVDLPNVIEYRKEILKQNERDCNIISDAFSEEWIKTIREKHRTEPILVTASGFFYYFKEDDVLSLFKMLKNYGNIEVVFDIVNSAGMKQMGKYMKQVGHEELPVYFCVDDAKEIAKKVGATLLCEEPYYAHINKNGFSLVTKVTMIVSDKCKMVKMVHLKLN